MLVAQALLDGAAIYSQVRRERAQAERRRGTRGVEMATIVGGQSDRTNIQLMAPFDFILCHGVWLLTLTQDSCLLSASA